MYLRNDCNFFLHKTNICIAHSSIFSIITVIVFDIITADNKQYISDILRDVNKIRLIVICDAIDMWVNNVFYVPF